MPRRTAVVEEPASAPIVEILLEQVVAALTAGADAAGVPLIPFAATAAAILIGFLVLIVRLFNRPRKLLPLDDFIALPLIKKQVLSHDTRRFTFALHPKPSRRNKNIVLGLPVGQHLTLQFTDTDTGKDVRRSYTPVTDDSDRRGQVSLVIKVYKPSPPKFPAGGVMSQHLDNLRIGDTVNIKGPKGHLHYYAPGCFSVKPLGKPLEKRQCNQYGLMAGGTGITPMLQILHAVFRNPSDKQTKIKLIYANQTVGDILVRTELEQLSAEHPDRFQLWYTVDRLETKKDEASWDYDTGFINKTMVERHLLFDTSNGSSSKSKTQFFMCGPPPMIKFACVPALKELGYTEKDWVIM